MRILTAGLALMIVLCGCNDNHTADAPSPAPVMASTPSPVAAVEQGSWQVDSETNPVTGGVTKTAYLRFQGRQNIYVRQKGKTLECYINTDTFLETIENLHSGVSTVQYRFDVGKPVRQGWNMSSDHEALFYPGNPKAFLTQMSKAKTLAFEYRPADKMPAAITFDVTGFPASFLK